MWGPSCQAGDPADVPAAAGQADDPADPTGLGAAGHPMYNTSTLALKHWVTIDIQWSKSQRARENLEFLKHHGCRVRELDAFELMRDAPGDESKAWPALVTDDVGVFILSNLCPRGPYHTLAKSEEIELTFGRYYRMLFSILRNKAPKADVLVLARARDGVMEELMSVAMPWYVQPLKPVLFYETPIVSVPSSARGEQIDDRYTAHGGGQLVGVSLGSHSSLNAIAPGAAFDLLHFLGWARGDVWFIGEGDAQLSAGCARELLKEQPLPCNPELLQEQHLPRQSLEGVAPLATREFAGKQWTFREVYERFCRQPHEESKPEGQHGFMAALHWCFTESSSQQCVAGDCQRAVPSWSSCLEHCCRTCQNTSGQQHGPVCARRHRLNCVLFSSSSRPATGIGPPPEKEARGGDPPSAQEGGKRRRPA